MKTHFLKFALAALCMSAAQAPSADSPSSQEIAMAKCSRDDASNGCSSNDDTSSKSDADQSKTASKVAAPARKSAAQKVVESEMEAQKAQ